jgi:hypothetical protein
VERRDCAGRERADVVASGVHDEVAVRSSGEIAEVVAVKGTLSGADRASLVAYFMTKFKL